MLALLCALGACTTLHQAAAQSETVLDPTPGPDSESSPSPGVSPGITLQTHLDYDAMIRQEFAEVFTAHPVLGEIYDMHRVPEMPLAIKRQFVVRYILTLKEKYLARGNLTFCTTYFYDYLYSLGYKPLLDAIAAIPGKNMIEKLVYFEKENRTITLLTSGYEAQLAANAGKTVGVIGEYYYDPAETIFTKHYSIVQPSLIAFDAYGNMCPYYVTGLISTRLDVNNRTSTGAFLVQVGVANGMLDFWWAYNRQTEGMLQLDADGNIRGGILFIIFPDIE